MPTIYSDLKDKVVLLTGIGQVPQEYDKEIWGNGAATAKVFVESGAKIFGCDVDHASAKATVTRVQQDIPNAQIEVVQTDVTKRSEVEALVAKCIEKYGRIDVLV